uniref:Uncharacterized protein n=1 Tax=Tetranychus urticae TaxID=32264 RepID=T1JRH6_TETUR
MKITVRVNYRAILVYFQKIPRQGYQRKMLLHGVKHQPTEIWKQRLNDVLMMITMISQPVMMVTGVRRLKLD